MEHCVQLTPCLCEHLLSETLKEVLCNVIATSFVSCKRCFGTSNLLETDYYFSVDLCFKDSFFLLLVDAYVLGCINHCVFPQKMAVLIHIFQ